MNHRLFIAFILLFLLTGNAQLALEKKIPKQATFVMGFNFSTLSTKINFNDLGNYTFLKKLDSEQSIQANAMLKELFRLPEKAGVNRVGKLFIFSENHDSISALTYLIPLTNAKAFESRILDILKTKSNNTTFKKDGKTKVLQFDHKQCYTIAKDYAIISLWNQPYYSVYDYDEYNEERNNLIHIIDSITAESLPADSALVEVEVPMIDTLAAPDTLEENSEPEIDTVYEDSVMAVEATPYPESNYDNNPLMLQFESKWIELRKQREDLFYVKHDRNMAKNHKFLTELKLTESLISNAAFAKVFSAKDDIIYWFNYDNYSQQLIDLMGDNYSYRYNADTAALRLLLASKPANKLAELLSNNTMYGLGNLEKGTIKMTFYNVFNDLLKPYIKQIYSNDINPDFFKYVKKENLIGMLGLSVNTEASMNLYYEILRRAIASNAVPNKYAVAAIELSDLFLDKNVIHHSFKGDALIAFTGIKSYLSNYTSFEYDSISLENRSVEKTKTKYIPEFISMFTIDNHANVKRIIKLIERLGGLTELSPNIYAFKSPKNEIDGQFFVVIKDRLLFITNDKNLATSEITLGLSPEKTVGNDYNAYVKYPSFGFLDATKLFKLMDEVNDDKVLKPKEIEIWSKKINQGFFVCKPMEANTVNMEITLEMKNRENSSILELLTMFDELYILNHFRN